MSANDAVETTAGGIGGRNIFELTDVLVRRSQSLLYTCADRYIVPPKPVTQLINDHVEIYQHLVCRRTELVEPGAVLDVLVQHVAVGNQQ
jgi:hypothetical protein